MRVMRLPPQLWQKALPLQENATSLGWRQLEHSRRGKAVGEDAALEKGFQLVLNKAREAISGDASFGEERREMLLKHAVERAALLALGNRTQPAAWVAHRQQAPAAAIIVERGSANKTSR